MKKKRIYYPQKTVNTEKRNQSNNQFLYDQQNQIELFNKKMIGLIHEIQKNKARESNSSSDNIQKSTIISELTTADLKDLHFFIRHNQTKLVSKNKYSDARNLILIGEDIDNELQQRGQILDSSKNSPNKFSQNGSPQSKNNSFSPTSRPKKALSHKSCQRIQKFDDETAALVNRLQMRHDLLFEDYARIWDQNMKSHYFTPSKNLQELRQQQLEIRQECIQREKELLHLDEEERMKDQQYKDLLDEFYEIDSLIRKLEEEETEIAQQEYENAFMIAQRKLEEKQGVEMQCLIEDRIIKRQRLLLCEGIDVTSYYPSGSKSQLNSRKPSPVNSRKNSPSRSPSKMLPLMSYTRHVNSKNSPDKKNDKTPRAVTKEAISKVTPNITVDIARSPCLIAIENRVSQQFDSNRASQRSPSNSPNKSNEKLPVFRNIKTNEDGTLIKTDQKKPNHQIKRHKSPQKTVKPNKLTELEQLNTQNIENEAYPNSLSNHNDVANTQCNDSEVIDDFENNPIPFDES